MDEFNEARSGERLPVTRYPASRLQVAEACVPIARYIRQYAPGDSLPTQRDLNRLFDFSNNTRNPVMRFAGARNAPGAGACAQSLDGTAGGRKTGTSAGGWS